MRHITTTEYRKGGHLTAKPDPFKNELLAYFESANPVAVAAGYFTDEVTGELVTDHDELGYIDGDWTWTAGDVYHFEKYDLELSDDFREYALDGLLIKDAAVSETMDRQ